MEDIQFDRFHAVQIALDGRDGHETMSGVDQQSAPGEARLIVNRHGGNSEGFRSNSHQLKERLEAAKRPKWVLRFQLNIGICDFEVIGFIFAQFLDGRARSRSLNDEMWFVEACLAPKRDAGFLGKPVQESLPRSFQPRFLVPFQSDAKMPVNNEFPLAAHNMRGKRHDRQRLVLSRAKIACGDNPAKRKQRKF